MFDPYHKWLAIPPAQRPPTHYQLLAISPSEKDPEVIEEAALQRTAHLRTYQMGPNATECTRLLNEIAQAKVVLLNPAKRQEYDAQLTRQQKAVGSGPAAPSGTSRKRLIAVGAGVAACLLLAVAIPMQMSGNRPDGKKDDTPAATDGHTEKKPPPEPRDIVWIDDALPEGAQFTKAGKAFDWGDAAAQPVLSGTHSVKASGPGQHARFFHGAAGFLAIHAGDALFAYVWLDPKDPPQAIMLQFYDGNRWDHRAYWGEDLLIAKGEPDAPHHRRRGPLPPPGKWTRLEVSAQAVGLVADMKINGLGLNQFGGTVYYDKMGIRTTAAEAGIGADMAPTTKKGKKKK